MKTEAVHAIEMAHYTNATAMACNSAPVTLVLGKTTEAEIHGKGMNNHLIQTSHTSHAK